MALRPDPNGILGARTGDPILERQPVADSVRRLERLPRACARADAGYLPLSRDPVVVDAPLSCGFLERPLRARASIGRTTAAFSASCSMNRASSFRTSSFTDVPRQAA